MKAFALTYPGATAGVACAGTALENNTVKLSKKASLFFGHQDAQLKLSTCLGELQALAEEAPKQYEAGKGGWVKIIFAANAAPSLSDARRWIDDSYRTMTTKTLLKKLDAPVWPAETFRGTRAPQPAMVPVRSLWRPNATQTGPPMTLSR